MSSIPSSKPITNAIGGKSIIGAPNNNDLLQFDAALNSFVYVPSPAGEANTSSNVGAGNGLALPKVGVDLPFKSLTAGSNVTLTPSGTEIEIASTQAIIPSGSGDGLTHDATEEETIPIVDDTSVGSSNLKRYAPAFTLPTDFEYFVITGIEWKNGSAVGGNLIGGVDIVDAIPPVSVMTKNVAYTDPVVTVSLETIQRANPAWAELIRKGSIISMWVISSITNNIRMLDAQPSINRIKSILFVDATNIQHVDDTPWTANVEPIYGIIYYKGVGKPI